MTETPWIRLVDMPERVPLSRSDVDQLRQGGLWEIADLAEKILDRRDRRLVNRLRRWAKRSAA